MPSRTISLRLPEEIAAELTARTLAHGGNESEIILEALSHAWGVSVPFPKTNRGEDFQHHFHAIKTYLEAISDYQTALQSKHNLALHTLENGDLLLECPLVPD